MCSGCEGVGGDSLFSWVEDIPIGEGDEIGEIGWRIGQGHGRGCRMGFGKWGGEVC